MSQCGIGSIINKNDGKIFIFKSKDLTKTWENYHALLNANYHHNKELQNEWNELGSSYFVFEIKEIIEDDSDLLNQKLEEYLKDADNAYSNANYNLLGAVIELVSGMSFAEYMEKEILTPLGLENTYVQVPDGTQNIIRGLRLGYRCSFGCKGRSFGKL